MRQILRSLLTNAIRSGEAIFGKWRREGLVGGDQRNVAPNRGGCTYAPGPPCSIPAVISS